MALDPKAAAEKRSVPVEPGRNAQSAPEGSAHRPEAFRTMNPARQDGDRPADNVRGVQEEGFYGSQAWEATSPDEQAAEPEPEGLTREQRRVTPEEVRRHAIAQGTDEPSIPRGRNPDSAMCEDRAHPGRIDKSNDC
jgi:hypothetical protein